MIKVVSKKSEIKHQKLQIKIKRNIFPNNSIFIIFFCISKFKTHKINKNLINDSELLIERSVSVFIIKRKIK